MKTNRHLVAAVIAAALLVACKETTSSEYVRTGRIAALMSATSEGPDSSTVHVELRAGGANSNTYVILRGGDTLSARVDAETKSLRAVDEGVYEGTFAGGGQVEVSINLDRAQDEDAPDSKATLPAAFTITGPQPEDTLSRSEDGLFITWTPVADAEGTLRLRGDCIVEASFAVSGGAGMWLVGAGELASADDATPESCAVDVEMTMRRDGAADPAFDEESYFFTSQKRTVSFTSDP